MGGILLVGGNIKDGRRSGTVNKMAKLFRRGMNYPNRGGEIQVFNGSLPEETTGFNLIIWAPDISNEEMKHYPSKSQGAVLICTKVIREGRTEVDAVSRIFSMHGNAVICIYKNEPGKFRFRLIDALGNVWCRTSGLEELACCIKNFYEWSKGQIRTSFVRGSLHAPPTAKFPKELIHINAKLADKVENGIGSRYFGNFSTRCMKLFPSMRNTHPDNYLFSPRNVDKKRIAEDDCVLVIPPYYYGQQKYSVDSPGQIMLYRQFDDINYMIHGHAFIAPAQTGRYETAIETKNYYPCGDLREVEEIARIFRTRVRAVNLKKHGFLLASKNLEEMAKLADKLTFVPNDLLR